MRIVRASVLPPAPPRAGCTSISVVVPARDEAARIGALVASVLAQDHPALELIVVDDRSIDATGDAARGAACGDPRVAVLRVEARPDGWQGKLHALAAGVAAARGETLLFLDADQRLAAPDLLRRLVAVVERRDTEAIALIAENVDRRWWDRWWIRPMVNNPLVWGVVLTVQRLHPNSPWLIGSFAMRRETYDALGGAEAAAGCGAGAYDDWGWARSLAERGWRSRMVYAPELEDATNFETLGDVVAGLARWLAGLFSYRKGGWWAAAAIACAILTLEVAAVSVAADLVRGRLPHPGVAALAAIAPTIGVGCCLWNRERLVRALGYFGVGLLVVTAIFAAAWVRWRNQVRWRGDIMRVASAAPGSPPSRGASR